MKHQTLFTSHPALPITHTPAAHGCQLLSRAPSLLPDKRGTPHSDQPEGNVYQDALPSRLLVLAAIDRADAAVIERMRAVLPASASIQVVGGADRVPDGWLPDAGPMVCADGPASASDHPALTQRQRQILQLLGDGQSNKAIGRSLGISHFTVRNHVSRLLQMFNASSRRTLEAFAEQAIA